MLNLGQATLYSNVDLNTGIPQINLAPDEIEKTPLKT